MKDVISTNKKRDRGAMREEDWSGISAGLATQGFSKYLLITRRRKVES